MEFCNSSTSDFYFDRISLGTGSSHPVLLWQNSVEWSCHNSVLLRLFRCITVFPPEETPKVSVFWQYSNLIKHRFYVAHECDRLSTESAENDSQIIREIRPLQVMAVEGLSLILCRAVENNPGFVGFLRMVHVMVRNVPDRLAVCGCRLLFWYPFSITTVHDLVHEIHVVLASAGFKSFLEGLDSVAW